MQCKHHASVTPTTEYGAVSDEVSGLVRRELHLRYAAGANLDIHIQITKAKSVCGILAVENENNGLPLFHGDLTGLERESASPLLRSFVVRLAPSLYPAGKYPQSSSRLIVPAA
jgi:hypothetical protein